MHFHQVYVNTHHPLYFATYINTPFIFTQVDPPCFIHPEVDGVRLIMPSSHALLQRVPDALQQVFSPGSTAPGMYVRGKTIFYKKGRRGL